MNVSYLYLIYILFFKDGKSKTIKKLFAIGPKFSKDMFGNTPLHYLIENHPEMVEAASSFATSIGI